MSKWTMRHAIGSTNKLMTSGVRLPKKGSGIPRIVVPCLDCGAKIGEHCKRPNGKTRGVSHRARLHLSAQKWLDEHGQIGDL